MLTAKIPFQKELTKLISIFLDMDGLCLRNFHVVLFFGLFLSFESKAQYYDLTIESSYGGGNIIFEIHNKGNMDLIIHKVPWFDSDMAYMTLCEVPYLAECKPRMDFLDTRYPYDVPIKSNSSVKGRVDISHLFGDFYDHTSGSYVLLWYFELNEVSYHGVVELEGMKN